MQLTFTADIAPGVMRNAMIFMGQALDAERPLNDLERLGWLVVCKYIVDRWLKGNKVAVHNQHDLPDADRIIIDIRALSISLWKKTRLWRWAWHGWRGSRRGVEVMLHRPADPGLQATPSRRDQERLRTTSGAGEPNVRRLLGGDREGNPTNGRSAGLRAGTRHVLRKTYREG